MSDDTWRFSREIIKEEICSIRKMYDLPCYNCKWAGNIACPEGYRVMPLFSLGKDKEAVYGEDVKSLSGLAEIERMA